MPAIFQESFFGTRASFMLDLICLTMGVILLLLALSIWLVRGRRRYTGHKRLQLGLGVALAVTVVLFELDVRLVTDWQARAEASPYFSRGSWNLVWLCLTVHLACAIPTTLLWSGLIIQSLVRFPRPPAPSRYSRQHAVLGWCASVGMLLTTLTGWLFYGLAFVAR